MLPRRIETVHATLESEVIGGPLLTERLEDRPLIAALAASVNEAIQWENRYHDPDHELPSEPILHIVYESGAETPIEQAVDCESSIGAQTCRVQSGFWHVTEWDAQG